MVIKPPEPSEEVRIQLARLMQVVVERTVPECFRAYLDDMVNIM